MAAHVLVVDDDPVDRSHIESILRRQGHSVEAVPDGAAALARLANPALPVSAVILDLVMPEYDGMSVLERMRLQPRRPPVIVQASAGSIDAGAAAMRAGAVDFLVKPAPPERVQASLANALKVAALESEIRRIRASHAGTVTLADMAAGAMVGKRILDLAERAARSSLPVLIEGEPGSGRKLLAQAIHASSRRAARPLLVLRCETADLRQLEELVVGKASRRARGGTLLLDEIAALAPVMQLRIAELLSPAFTMGTEHPMPGKLSFIATSARRLVDLVADGQFDLSLFNRLNVQPIWLPPLRDRPGELAGLIRALVPRIAAEVCRPECGTIAAAAVDYLVSRPWRGNIPELEAALFRAVTLAQGALQVTDFTRELPAPRRTSGRPVVAERRQAAGEGRVSRTPIPDSGKFARYGMARLLDERGEIRRIGALEEEAIRFAIDHCRGRMSEVARRLGIGRSTLYRKMKCYGIAGGDELVT